MKKKGRLNSQSSEAFTIKVFIQSTKASFISRICTICIAPGHIFPYPPTITAPVRHDKRDTVNMNHFDPQAPARCTRKLVAIFRSQQPERQRDTRNTQSLHETPKEKKEQEGWIHGANRAVVS